MALLLRLLTILLGVFASYYFWKLYRKKREEGKDKPPLPWYKESWIWFSIILVVVSLLTAIISVTMDTRRGKYMPAHYQDNILIPGHYE